MRKLLALLIVGLLVAGAAFADFGGTSEPLAELHEAAYITTSDMEVALPHGSLSVSRGVVASLGGADQRAAGAIVGDIVLTLDKLPSGPGVLNLLAELEPGSEPIERRATHAFYSIAKTAVSQVNTGYPVATRSWAELDPAEQEEFESIYLQAYSDGWIESGAATGMGAEHCGAGVTPRLPVGEETYAAVWTVDGGRWDYRIDESGENFTLTDYDRNFAYVRQPRTPRECEPDDAVEFTRIKYGYEFWPPSMLDDGGRSSGGLYIWISAESAVTDDREQLGFVSYPWLVFDDIWDYSKNGYLEYSHRRGEGQSDCMLFVEGDFKAASTYELDFGNIDGRVPDTCWGIGYGGVYRFDTAALWPGEDHAADIEINVRVFGKDWVGIASEGGTLDCGYWPYQSSGGQVTPADRCRAEWTSTSRNQMLVVTKFPSRTLPTSWGELEVYTPPELIDGVEEMEIIVALSAAIEYFNELWGDRGVAAQPVFLIPEETGAQAFEKAGMIFILDCDRGSIPEIAREAAHLWRGHDVKGPNGFSDEMASGGAAEFLEHYYGEGDPLAGPGDPQRYESTPAREDYLQMLRWLRPAYRKQALGDYVGALYCAQRALDYRNEPKDYLFLAELTFKAGDLDIAWERCAALLENPTTPDDVKVKLHWLLSRIYRAQGQDDQELLALEYVIKLGNEVAGLSLLYSARLRRDELTSETTH